MLQNGPAAPPLGTAGDFFSLHQHVARRPTLETEERLPPGDARVTGMSFRTAEPARSCRSANSDASIPQSANTSIRAS